MYNPAAELHLGNVRGPIGTKKEVSMYILYKHLHCVRLNKRDAVVRNYRKKAKHVRYYTALLTEGYFIYISASVQFVIDFV